MCINKPLFSIITVSYNSEKTIERTLKSMLQQLFKDFEYIVVDGKSNDRTTEILQEYEPLFENRMTWISESDTGIYDAMNKGIKRARGKYIGILNSDDWYQTDTLLTISALNILEEDIVISGHMLYHYDDGSKRKIEMSEQKASNRLRKYSIPVNHPATFVSLSVYKKYGIFDTNFRIFADEDLLIRCHSAGVVFIFVDKILTNMSDGGISSVVQRKMLKEKWMILERHCPFMVLRVMLIFAYICKCTTKIFFPPLIIRWTQTLCR